MVTMLLMLVFVAVLQLAFALWTRNTLVAAAQEGARVAARADATPAMGVARAQQVIRAQLSDSYASDVTAGEDLVGSVEVATITVRTPLPVLGPFGPDRALTVTGRAHAETQ